MSKKIFALMAFVALSFVGCKSDADDGVGEKPRPSTEDSFYFRNGATHTIHMIEDSDREVIIDGASDNFTFDSPSTALRVEKLLTPARLKIHAYLNETGNHDIRITDGASVATLTVVIDPRDRGWDQNGNLTVENIDGDLTEATSRDYVDIEAPVGFTYQQNTLSAGSLSAAQIQDRITITPQQGGNKVRVTAKNHYDEPTPITFKFTNTQGEERTVIIKRVTKFWRIISTTVNGLSNGTYVTQRSFEQLSAPPKMPYAARFVSSGSSQGGNSSTLYGNPAITKVDLNNVESVGPYAFLNSANLTTVVANKLKTVDYGAFGGTKITRFTLPEVEAIRGYPSANLRNRYDTFPNTLQIITIGNKIKSINGYAFYGTESSLREVRIELTTPNQLTMSQPVIGTNNTAALSVPNSARQDWINGFPWLETQFKGGVRGF